ncbi:hypothetical protein [Lysobacter sp. ESA13C]|uniref:hypothetical protein n=1 Tax=Lysobacter sp. ESA13C TaxID=2862676 RepID=UPI001CBAB3E3|nr:hypothetical protein [Lysobacter sp. ESA13C]
MTIRQYVTPESDRFMLPVSIAAMAALTLMMLNTWTLLLWDELSVGLYWLPRSISTLMAVSLIVISALIWKLYLSLLIRLNGRKDARTAWLATAVTAACLASTLVVAFTVPLISANRPETTVTMAACAQLITVLPTLYFAAKVTFSIAALFEALRATEKARLTEPHEPRHD